MLSGRAATCASTPASRSPGAPGAHPGGGAAGTILGNWQPWHFVVVTDYEQLGELAEVWQGGRHIVGSAATIGLVAAEPEDQRHRDWLMYEFGQATAFIMLAAADLGIGSGHSAVLDQDQARRVLGFPDGYRAVYRIGLGYPADRPLRPLSRPNRRPFDEVVHWVRW
jgi:nitroreductase